MLLILYLYYIIKKEWDFPLSRKGDIIWMPLFM